ncbi:sgd1p, putative [Entamoeba dispar SAW760]|uniref:Sgd1p, putative n=1 Tax=Entamoeba dispar (strain ATCC PRA-260 / SAW760) TaxID=370354 RepID=B0EMG0_ENTDS|nr:sgd1p, putative [Entamoeba dispar SAW760]EDR24283.1 sgd1p, putative [Entamoeba dispar SAW760]|eukprot:EDR24283.1 sgd1p, putative [Entamoeba dispar SAW760]
MSEQEVLRFVRGQLNRISESTLEGIIGTVSGYYQQYPKAFVTQAIITCCIKTINVMSDLTEQVLLLSAFVSGISGAVDIGICGELLQELFQEPPTGSVAVFLCGLYYMKVIDEKLLIELLIESIEKNKFDIVMAIIQNGGNKIRNENPKCLREILIKVNEVIKGKELSVKEKFVIESLNDLKNNKLVGKNEVVLERYKKIIGIVWKKYGVTKGFELSVGLKNIIDKTNKWWEAGSAHSEMFVTALTNQGENETVAKAREHHMNTELRKAIFIALMGAMDYVDGYQRILQLGLHGEQEREVVFVLMYCLGQSKTYNKYFELIAEQIIQKSKSNKFTFQIAFYERMKDLEKYSIRAIINWATLLGVLISKDFLGLRVLKGINLITPTTMEIVFARTVLQRVLGDDSMENVTNIFTKLIALKDVDSLKIRKGIHLFLLKKMGKCQDPSQRHLIEKRKQMMIKLLNSSVDALM